MKSKLSILFIILIFASAAAIKASAPPHWLLFLYLGALFLSGMSCKLMAGPELYQQARKQFSRAWANRKAPLKVSTEEIMRIALIARKEGILSMETHRGSVQNLPFKQALKRAMDGWEPEAIRQIMDARIASSRRMQESISQVVEAFGVYLAVSGVVFGLLGFCIGFATSGEGSQVILRAASLGFPVMMSGLMFGYGIFIPMGRRVYNIIDEDIKLEEFTRIGLTSIQEGANPLILQERLEAWLGEKIKTSST